MNFDDRCLRIGLQPCICMFTLQTHPKIIKSEKLLALGGPIRKLGSAIAISEMSSETIPELISKF